MYILRRSDEVGEEDEEEILAPPSPPSSGATTAPLFSRERGAGTSALCSTNRMIESSFIVLRGYF